MENTKKPTYDKRTVTRYIEKGILTQTEFDKHRKTLPDESNNAQWVQIDMDSNDFDGAFSGEESEGAADGAARGTEGS